MTGSWKIACILLLWSSMLWGCTSNDPIEQLIEDLHSNYGYKREQACKRIGRLGRESLRAIPALRSILRTDQSDYVRRCAADALGYMGPSAHSALPELIRSFRDRSGGVRMAAAAAVGKMKGNALPSLQKILKGTDGHMQLYALRALVHLGVRALPLLEKAAYSKYLEVRQNAAETIVSIGRSLQKKSDSPEVRKARAQIIRTLSVLLQTPHIKLRTYITWSLSELAPTGLAHSSRSCEILVQAMDTLLKDAPNQVKMYAAYTLRQLGRKALKSKALRTCIAKSSQSLHVVSKLRIYLDDQTWYIRKHAASASAAWLAAIHPQRIELSARQAFAFRKQYQKERVRVVRSLGRALLDPTWDVRYEAARALRTIRGRDAWKALAQHIRHPKPKLREHIVQSLGWMARETPKSFPSIVHTHILPQLFKRLDDPRPKVARAAEDAIALFRGAAYIPISRRFNRISTQKIQQTLRILGKLGKHAHALKNLLEQKLLSPTSTPLIRRAINRALRSVAPLSKQNIQTHIQVLQKTSSQTNSIQRSALFLGRTTPHAKHIRSALLSVLNHSNASIRLRALEVLGHIEFKITPSTLQKVLKHWNAYTHTERTWLLQSLYLTHRTCTPELLPLLESSSASAHPALKAAALEMLIQWWPHPKITALLLRSATRSSVRESTAVLHALAKPLPLSSSVQGIQNLRQTEEKILPFLLKKTRHSRMEIRMAAFKALSGYGLVYGSRILPAFLQGMRDRKAPVRAQAAQWMGWLAPTFIRYGWKEKFLRQSILDQGRIYTYKKLRALRASTQKEEDTLRHRVQKRYASIQSMFTWSQNVAKKMDGQLQKMLRDSNARARRNALFALTRSGTFAFKKRKQSILHVLLKQSQKNRARWMGRNLCHVLGRWISHQENETIVRALQSIHSKTKPSSTTRKECKNSIRYLRSDDKPYVLWVNHPRSPTLEAFAPEILYPNGP